jgi:S1-C subfamily serine protease
MVKGKSGSTLILRIALALLCSAVLPALTHGSPQEVARSLFPKTVLLTMKDTSGRPLALGSGFVLKKGYIVSNCHVIEGAGSGLVKPTGDAKNYKIVGIAAKDESRDLVILEVDGLTSDGVVLSTNQAPEVGETVFALGNPRGLEGTFSEGIISSLRDLDGLSLLQITAPISPGSSGGPIADEKGEVIGVAVATFTGGQNLNFAVPAKYVAQLSKTVAETVPLSHPATTSKGKTLFDNLQSGKSTDGLTTSAFLWDGSSPEATLGNNGEFTVSLKNNLDSGIRTPVVLVLFYDNSGEVVDTSVVSYNGVIPPGMAKRVGGAVDPSTKKLTTPISRNNQYMYSDKPNTRLEYRTLGFTLESE